MADEAHKKRTFRKYSYRGVDLEQLLDMSTDQLVELFASRQRRRYILFLWECYERRRRTPWCPIIAWVPSGPLSRVVMGAHGIENIATRAHLGTRMLTLENVVAHCVGCSS